MWKRSSGPVQIVIAWTTEEVEFVRARRTDLGERPETRMVKVAHAAMWLNSGTEDDLRKAREYASANGYRAFSYVTDERDPLGCAKADVLRAVRS
jgi:hypothetical protein